MNKSNSLKQNQNGYAAIVITMLIMAILALISIGFSTNALMDQKNALRDVLTAQAYYSAESGANNAYDIIAAYNKLGVSLTNIPAQTSQCLVDNKGNQAYINTSGSTSLNSNQLSSVDSYSCLLVNPEPYSLEYKPINANVGQTIPIITSSKSSITTIEISWQEHNPALSSYIFNSCPKLGDLPSLSNYNCSAPIIQVDLIPSSDVTNNSSYIINHTVSFFVQPEQVSVAAANPTPSNSQIIPGNCNSSGSSLFKSEFNCDIKFNVPTNLQSTFYYMHITPIYQPADLSVQAYDSSASVVTPIALTGAQALIDVTGSSVGTSKRIEERICISDVCQNNSPSGAILSLTNICKEFQASPQSISDQSGSSTCSI